MPNVRGEAGIWPRGRPTRLNQYQTASSPVNVQRRRKPAHYLLSAGPAQFSPETPAIMALSGVRRRLSDRARDSQLADACIEHVRPPVHPGRNARAHAGRGCIFTVWSNRALSIPCATDAHSSIAAAPRLPFTRCATVAWRGMSSRCGICTRFRITQGDMAGAHASFGREVHEKRPTSIYFRE